MINVTRSFLPSREEYMAELAPVWESRWLTNNGPIHQKFEAGLREFLRSPNVTLFTNGHLALEGVRSLNRVPGLSSTGHGPAQQAQGGPGGGGPGPKQGLELPPNAQRGSWLGSEKGQGLP